MESLERRQLLTASPVYVDNDWLLVNDVDHSHTLSVGDLVSHGTATNRSYGVDAFGVVTSSSDLSAPISSPTSVPGSATLQDAINGASSGGTVNIFSGTYTGALSVGSSLTIQAVDGAGTATIDAGAAATGITVASGANVAITGIVLQHISNFGTGINVKGSLDLEQSTIDLASGPTGGQFGVFVDASGGPASLMLKSSTILGRASGAGTTVYDVELEGGAGAAASIEKSSLSGGTAGDVRVGFGTAVISQSILHSSATSTGVFVVGSGHASIHDSDLSDNTVAITNATLPADNITVDASRNYWGTSSESAVQAKTAGAVDFTPYLAGGTDNGTQFDPDLSHSYVTALGSQVGATGRIQEAIGDVADGSLVGGGRIINVNAGTYSESVVVNKAVQLLGANAGVAGAASRGAESIIHPAGNTSGVVTVTASNVTISGLDISGDDPATIGLPVFSGADANALYGITNGNTTSATAINGLSVTDNIIERVAVGLLGNGVSGGSTTSVIDANLFRDIGVFDFGYSISLRNNFYANITNNVMQRVYTGVHLNAFYTPKGSAWLMQGNQITSYANGLWDNNMYGTSQPLAVTSNQFSEAAGAVANNIGILVTNGPGNVAPVLSANTITNHDYGIVIWDTQNSPTFLAGNTITGATVGVYVTNNVGFNPIGTTPLGLTGDPTAADLAGVTIGAATTGILVRGDAAGGTVSTTIEANTNITSTVAGVAAGVQVSGSKASALVQNDSNLTQGVAVGIDIVDGTATVSGTTITSDGDGIDVSGAGHATITGNTITAKANGIGVFGTSVVSIGNGTALGANQIDAGIDGVTVQNSAQATINDNVLFNNLSVGGVGVQLVGSAVASIDNNVFGVGGAFGTDVKLIGGTLSSLTGNALAASNLFIDNETSQYVDATSGNTFGGVNPSSASVAQLYGIEDKIVDGIDQAGLGLVRLKNGQVYVSHSSEVGPQGSAGSIGRAIGLASSGDTLHIAGGSYSGSVDTTSKALTLELGASPGQVTINGNLALDGNDTLHMEINGVTTAGTDFDQLVVNGTVNLGGATLSTVGSTVSASNGQSVEIVSNDGSDPVSNTFLGLANGATLLVNGQLFEIFYDGGDGNDVTLTRIPSAPPPSVVYVDDNWASSTNGTDVDAAGPGSAFGYDEFATIQSAVNAVATGGTVIVDAGRYAENVTINKSLTLNGAQAGQTANPRFAAFVGGVADPTVESIITAPSVSPSSGALVHILSSGVTLDGLVIDGSNPNLPTVGAARINGVGPYIDIRNGIDTVDPINGGQAVNNLTIEDNIVQNVNHNGIALINPSSGSSVSSGSLVTGNVVGNFLDYGVLLAYNAYADVTYNTITMPNLAEAGIWVYDFTANGGTAAEQTIHVAHNTVTAGQDDFGAIWANLDYAPTATLYITDNTVNAAAGVTGSSGYTNGIYLSSLQNGFGAVLTNNTVGSSGGQFATGISLWNLPTTNTVTVSGGSVGNSLVGIEVDNDDINFLTGASTAVSISGVSITGGDTGILVLQHSGGGAVSATISGVTVDDPTVGIDVDGGDATISGSHIFNNGTGIEFIHGGHGSVGTTNFAGATSNVTDLLIDSTAGSVSIGDGNAFAGATYTIESLSSQAFDLSGYTTTTFGGFNAATTSVTGNLATFYGVEDKIVDYLDQPSSGYVRIKSGYEFIAHSSEAATANAISRGVYVSNSGDIVEVQAGTFVDNIVVPRSLTILGAGKASTTIVPALSAPMPSAAGSLPPGASNVILVQASNVEISGLTIDGNNPSLLITSGVVAGGFDIDARNGIIEDFHAGVFDNTYVHDVTVKNIFLRGIYASSGGHGFRIIDNTVDNVQGSNQSIAIFNFAGAGEIAGNHVSNAADAIATNHSLGTAIHDNVVTSSASGIHSDNNGDGAGAAADSIHNNTVSAGSPGSYGIFVFVPYVNVSVQNNTVSGVGVGLGAFGGQGGSANFSGNTVGVNVSGTGAVVSTDTFGFGDMDVTASFNGDSFTHGATGILVHQAGGASASAGITGVTINDPAIGIDVSGGSVMISGGHIFNNGTGIRFIDGGHGSASGVNFDGTTDNSTDLLLTQTAGTVTIGAGNKFAGDTFYIDDQTSQSYDLSSNGTTFDETGADRNFRIEDKMHHRVDTTLSNGLITWVAGNLYVTTPGLGSTDSDIQRGVDAASAGNTVNVEAGSYDISAGLTINKQLTLSGAQDGVPAAGRSGSESILNGPASQSQGMFTIGTMSPVAIGGFTLDGSKIVAGEPDQTQLTFRDDILDLQAMAAAGQTNMILHNPQSLILTDNHFTTTGSNPSNSAVIQIVGSYSGGADTTNLMHITGNTFTGIADDFDQATLQLNLSNVQGTVSNNTFDGVDIGVLVANSSGNLTLNGNTFKNITRGATENAGGSFGAGIALFNPVFTSGPVTISNNTFQNSDTGIRTSTDGSGTFTLNDSQVSISGNVFSGNIYDIVDKFGGTLTPAGTNTFDGVQLSTASTAQLYAIEDKVVDAIDVSGYGLIRLKAGNIYVTPNSFFAPGSTNTPSIQRGVDAASAGDVLHIKSGVYAGGVDTDSKGLTLDVGASPGQVTINGNLSLHSGDTLLVELNGTSAADYDNLTVNGAVSLGGAQLSVSLGFTPNATTVFKLINNDLADAVSGDFFSGLTDLIDGSTIIVNSPLGNIPLKISYVGDTNNDVTLTVVSPTISVTKHANVPSVPEGGVPSQSVTYTYAITNTSPTGTYTVTVSSISDNPLGSLLAAAESQNGGNPIMLAPGQSYSFTYATTAPVQNASTTFANVVTVGATDSESDTATGMASATIGYTNVTPVASIDSISTPRKEGTPIMVVGSEFDPATTDPITFGWNVYKNGNPTAYASGSGLGMTNFAFTPNDNGSYQIVLQVTDDEASSDSTSQTITVANVAPALSNVTITPSINENGTVTLQGDITDPGALDNFTLVVNWEGTPQSFSLAAGTTHFSETHQYLDDNPTATPSDNYNVSVSLTDKDGDSDSTSVLTTVNNVNPVLDSLSFALPADINAATNLIGTYHDVGTQDTHILSIDWDGDNVYDQTVAVSGGGFSVPHTYTTSGVRTVHVKLVDDDTGFTTGSTSVTVINPNALQVTNFADNNSGFDVTFNHSPTLADLNLYDGPDAATDLPDVTLVGDHVGTVRGSLVWSAATNTMSFVATGGALADDTYHVTLVSGQNGADPLSLGFHDSVGFLDGNGDFIDTQHPDNYTHSFTISTDPGTRVVSIHDFARGPGQHVDDDPAAPGLSRIAVSVDNAAGVKSLDFQMPYNPALLTVNGASLVSGLPGTWIITVNTTTPGLLVVSASGTQPLSGTNRAIVLIDAEVPSTAPYESSEVLQLNGVKLNGNFIASKADFAVQKVAYLGDADGSGNYGAADGVFIQRVAVGLDTGFDAHDWTDPLIIGDITDVPNNPPSIDGFDASLVLQKALGQPVAQLPNVPGAPLTFASNIDPVLSIPSNIRPVGNTVTVGVSINVDPAAAGKVYGITFDVTYVGSTLQFTPPANSNDMLGPYTPAASGWNVGTNAITADDLRVGVFNFTNTAPVGSGTIVNLPFQLLASPSYGSITITSVGINKNSDPHEDGLMWTTSDGSVAYGFPRGDFDLNGQITIADVAAGMRALTDLSTYQSDNELSPPQVSAIGNVNQDTSVDNKDIQSLLVALANQAPMSPADASSPALASAQAAPALASPLALAPSADNAVSSQVIVSSNAAASEAAAGVSANDEIANVQQPPAIAEAISIPTVSTTFAAQPTPRSLFDVALAPSADADGSVGAVHGVVASNGHPTGPAVTAIDDFYEQMHGRAAVGSLEHGRHAAAASDADAITDDYHEELALQLLPS